MSDPVITYYAVTFKDAFYCQRVLFTPDIRKTVAVPAAIYAGDTDDGTTFASHCLTATPLYGPFPT